MNPINVAVDSISIVSKSETNQIVNTPDNYGKYLNFHRTHLALKVVVLMSAWSVFYYRIIRRSNNTYPLVY